MVKDREVLFRLEGEEAARERVAASMPDYQKPDIKPGSDPTFEAKKSDLYHARNISRLRRRGTAASEFGFANRRARKPKTHAFRRHAVFLSLRG